jgi:hypothetical protein
MIMRRATDVDLIAVLLRYAVGEVVALPPQLEVKRSCGSWVFGAPHAGRLASIAGEQELRDAVPEVFEYLVNYRLGDDAPEFVHSGNSLGYVLFDIPDRSSYDRVIDRIQGAMHLEVAGNGSHTAKRSTQDD